ncbi:MAG: sensor histidine kinase [Rhizobiales bacterium]|nr:sensor histidine kinase [Hyphomicrobiales bacterium]
MLDKPKDIETDRNETDEALESENLSEAAVRPPLLTRLAPTSLTARIALINILGLLVLAFGILYFNQFRQGLIDARVQSLTTQAQIIAGAIAGSASADTGNIVITPESLDDFSENAQSDINPVEGLDFPIDPEKAGPVLRRLLANTKNRARIIDPDGNLIVDSRFLMGGSDLIESEGPVTVPPPNAFARWWNSLFDWVFGYDYPVHSEYGLDGNKDAPEVAAALNGASVSIVRLNDDGQIIVLVSVPVQRFRAVLGALVLSNRGGEIDNVVWAERRIVLLTFGFATLVALLLSVALASTIAKPIRLLSAAAQKVRRGVNTRVEIPDFTRRRDEIGHLSGSLRDMTGALYKRIDAIEAFAADVSHELKNPLTSLRSAVETLNFVKTDEQRQRLIDIVKHDVKRMDRLITDISDASRLDAELSRSESSPVDIAKLLGAIVILANETSKAGDAEVMLVVQPPGPGLRQDMAYRVLGQDSRLSQVFRNLIDNARSFTVSGTKIFVRIRRSGGDIEVRVEDSGPGIRPENLERVFERFYTDRPEQSFGKNSGLGLAISRQIVEAHKGRIWAENREGREGADGVRPVLGARFIVRIPMLAADWVPPVRP